MAKGFILASEHLWAWRICVVEVPVLHKCSLMTVKVFLLQICSQQTIPAAGRCYPCVSFRLKLEARGPEFSPCNVGGARGKEYGGRSGPCRGSPVRPSRIRPGTRVLIGRCRWPRKRVPHR